MLSKEKNIYAPFDVFSKNFELYCEAVRDRDRWKKKAEALERGIKSLKKFNYSAVCNLCNKRISCKECRYKKDCDKWEFDEARFSEEGGNSD